MNQHIRKDSRTAKLLLLATKQSYTTQAQESPPFDKKVDDAGNHVQEENGDRKSDTSGANVVVVEIETVGNNSDLEMKKAITTLAQEDLLFNQEINDAVNNAGQENMQSQIELDNDRTSMILNNSNRDFGSSRSVDSIRDTDESHSDSSSDTSDSDSQIERANTTIAHEDLPLDQKIDHSVNHVQEENSNRKPFTLGANEIVVEIEAEGYNSDSEMKEVITTLAQEDLPFDQEIEDAVNHVEKNMQPLIELDNSIISDNSNNDFGSSSSDDFICDSEEIDSDSSSDTSIPKKRRKRNTNYNQRHIVIGESDEGDLSSKQDNEQPGCSFWKDHGMNAEGKKEKPRRSKKERRDERLKRKENRNKGLEYVNSKGKKIKSRQFKDLEKKCRQKCKDRLSVDQRKKIFEEYWALGTYDKRIRYMEKCIEISRTKTSKTSPKKRRDFVFRYKVQTNDFQIVKICKQCLLGTLDESNRFLQTVCEKIKSHGFVPPRKRSSKIKIPESKLNEIKEHIMSFPSVESHYGRSKTTKKFHNTELNLQTMYDLYKDKYENPVSKTIFAKVFKLLNLSFKKPSLDTCSKCDSLNMKLKYAIGSEAVALKQQLEDHQVAFQAAYNQKRADKERAQSRDDLVVVTFDLQQCLPTPYLKTSVAFYKRQLWTYNLTIHDVKSNKAFCYMWPECTGGRGANDIASCLYDFIMNQLPALNPTAKHLILYSDSCPGQNKNSVVATMLMMVAQLSTQLETIEHKFLIPGHTHMEADSDHALIERKKKRSNMDIHLPRDWFQLVKTASNKLAKFTVIEMTQDMFYDFADFSKKSLTIRKTNQNNDKFVWASTRMFTFSKAGFPTFQYKDKFDESANYLRMDYSKVDEYTISYL